METTSAARWEDCKPPLNGSAVGFCDLALKSSAKTFLCAGSGWPVLRVLRAEPPTALPALAVPTPRRRWCAAPRRARCAARSGGGRSGTTAPGAARRVRAGGRGRDCKSGQVRARARQASSSKRTTGREIVTKAPSLKPPSFSTPGIGNVSRGSLLAPQAFFSDGVALHMCSLGRRCARAGLPRDHGRERARSPGLPLAAGPGAAGSQRASLRGRRAPRQGAGDPAAEGPFRSVRSES